jgi:hypothetical protein
MQTDWGGEYEKFNSFFATIGITHLVSCPHPHQQNGAAERKHRHVVEEGLSLLSQGHMPLKYWDEAFIIVTFMINRTPSKVINYITPLERLFKVTPNYSSLRSFRCSCWPHLRPYNSHKLEFHSKEYVFMGYSNKHKGFKCLDLSTGLVYISRGVIFDENVFPFAKLNHNAGPRLRAEISLLLSSLVSNPPRVESVFDHMVNLPKQLIHVPKCSLILRLQEIAKGRAAQKLMKISCPYLPWDPFHRSDLWQLRRLPRDQFLKQIRPHQKNAAMPTQPHRMVTHVRITLLPRCQRQ